MDEKSELVFGVIMFLAAAALVFMQKNNQPSSVMVDGDDHNGDDDIVDVLGKMEDMRDMKIPVWFN